MFKKVILLVLVMILLVSIASASKIENKVIEKINKEGKARVIIILNNDSMTNEKKFNKNKIKNLQNNILSNFSKGEFQLNNRYVNYPAISGILNNKKALEKLEKSPYAKSVYEDRIAHAILDESSPLINADFVNSYGYTGKNVGVCVIDTGVDYTHPDLGDSSCSITVTTNGNAEAELAESRHPYKSNTNNVWTITKPGYGNIAVHFNKIETEIYSDFIYILDEYGNIVQVFSGIYNDTWSISIPGDTIKINLVSNSVLNYYGFKVDTVLNGTTDTTWNNCGDIINGYNFQNNDYNPFDDNGHGSHVAGIITSDNTIYTGIAPEANIVAHKVLNSDGYGYFSNAAAAIDWCIENKDKYNIKIISMSLGDGGQYNNSAVDCDPYLTAQMISLAKSSEITTIVASGNNGYSNGLNYPACASDAVSVGAVYDANVGGIGWSSCTDSTTYADKVVCFTNTDEILDIMAPGALVTSTVPTGSCDLCNPSGFNTLGGTSMATPMASGLAALLLQKEPSSTPTQLLQKLKKTNTYVTDIDNGLSFPRIDAMGALSDSFELNLMQGWNLISLPLVSKNNSVNNFLKSIGYSALFSYDSIWKIPTEINHTKGYWIKVNEENNLTVSGILPINTSINLKQGWNLVGYPNLNASLINETLRDINYSIVYAYNNSWLSYNPLREENRLRHFVPGYGFWVYSNENTGISIS